MKKAVITGGPCAGKSIGIETLAARLRQRGFNVYKIGETATELINSGITPESCGSRYEFQSRVFELQSAKEKFYEHAAEASGKDAVLLFDRGKADCAAYLSEDEMRRFQKRYGNLRDMILSYDAVVHLVSAAKGAESFYNTTNNTARTETLEEAAALDDRVIAAWSSHPSFTVIDNSTDFDKKLDRLTLAVLDLLGKD